MAKEVVGAIPETQEVIVKDIETGELTQQPGTEVQAKIAELQEKGWTLAALSDELGVTVNAVEKWKAGDRQPTNSKAVLSMLDRINMKKRVPKKRRYHRSSKV